MVLRSCLSDEYFNHFHSNCAQPTNIQVRSTHKKKNQEANTAATATAIPTTNNYWWTKMKRNASFKMHFEYKICITFSVVSGDRVMFIAIAFSYVYILICRIFVLLFWHFQNKCTSLSRASFNLYTRFRGEKNTVLSSWYIHSFVCLFVDALIASILPSLGNIWTTGNVYLLRRNWYSCVVLIIYFIFFFLHFLERFVWSFITECRDRRTQFMPSWSDICHIFLSVSHGFIFNYIKNQNERQTKKKVLRKKKTIMIWDDHLITKNVQPNLMYAWSVLGYFFGVDLVNEMKIDDNKKKTTN